jgi:hypothetical protein
MKTALIIIIQLVVVVVFAEASFSAVAAKTKAPSSASRDDSNEILGIYRNVIQRGLEQAASVSPTCEDCAISLTGDNSQREACRSAYSSLYSRNASNTIDMRLVVGYLDVNGATDDTFAAMAVIENLLAPCNGRGGACGFVRDADDAELFTKSITDPNSDTVKTIKLHVLSSSVSSSDKLNRETLAADQAVKTRRAEDVFFEGLSKADVVLYAGHDRGGGGPSFGPPMLDPKTKGIDFKRYQETRESERRMLKVLSQSPTPAQVVSVFACDAQAHHGGKLQVEAPKTGVVLGGHNSYFTSSVLQAYLVLDSVIAMRCEAEFNQVLNAVDFFEKPLSRVSIQNFFRSR